MATTITNQASLTYNFGDSAGTAVSNLASATLLDVLSAFKTAVNESYTAGQTLTYVYSFVNSGATPLTDVTITDNLGSYTLAAATVTPLTYVGPALLYLNGVPSGTLSPTVGANNIVFTIPNVAAGTSVVLIYDVVVNGNAPLIAGSDIINTASLLADGITPAITDSATVPVAGYADVRITKSMSPNPVSAGGSITYVFQLENYGNADATGVVLTDSFSPVPTSVTVSVDGSALSPADYTYLGGTLTLPTGSAYALSIPAATFTQAASGAVTVTPGIVTVTVVGTF